MDPTSVPPASVTPSWDVFPQQGLEPVDIAVLVLYFLFVLAVGLWSMWKTQRSTVKGYFLAGGQMVWWPVGASLFASNVGSGHFIGLAGSGAASGIAATAYEWNGMFCVLVLAWLFLPIYISSGVTTMPEYLQRRFGGKRIQIFLAILYLFIYIFTKISVSFIEVGGLEGLQAKYFDAIPSIRRENSSCGLPREDAFHIFRDPVSSDLPWPGVLVGMTIPSLWYWCTDQVIVQRSLAAKNLSHAKGGSLMTSYLKILPLFMMVMPGMISRVLFPDLVACADPEICKKICGNPSGCSDIAYPKLVLELLPVGKSLVRALALVGSARGSHRSLGGKFQEEKSLELTQGPDDVGDDRSPHVLPDLHLQQLQHHLHHGPLETPPAPLLRVGADDRGQVGRTGSSWIRGWCQGHSWAQLDQGRAPGAQLDRGGVFVLLLTVVSILWIPLVQAGQGGQLFIYIQSISSYLQPPVAMVFILGCFWRRANEKGAFWGLLLGLLLGVVRLVLDFIYPEPRCGEPDPRPGVIKYMHYLYFSMVLGAITTLTVLVVSVATEPPAPQMVREPAVTELEKELAPNPSPDPRAKDALQLELSPAAENPPDDAKGAAEAKGSSKLLSTFLWLCGMEHRQEGAENVPKPEPLPVASLEEKALVKHVLNINLLL
ncbi:Sodium/myo-inositol cotransporter 2, partial [Lamprotornis superbus]